MNKAQAKIKQSKRFSSIWILPILVFAVGGWIVIKTIREKGPLVVIEFSNAEGLVAGKSKIKVRSVDLGLVETIRLSDDFSKVEVVARLSKQALPMLTHDAVFWVVKPRIGTAGVSGVGTLLSGAYIELNPGKDQAGRRKFVGSEGVPSTPLGTPGTRVVLHSSNAKSLSPGDAVTYRGYRVGRVESTIFDSARKHFEYNVFVEAPYDELITTSSRFWNTSGISLEANADGISLRTTSLESVLSGGVTFDLPEKAKIGSPIEDDHAFTLFADARSVQDEPFAHYIDYLLMFDTSVRWLKKGAPVEYRGIKIGSVVDVSFDYLPDGMALEIDQIPVPVLIRIDPARLDMEDSEESCKLLAEDLASRTSVGMKARLETGSLLTGSLFVSFDFYENGEESKVEKLGEYTVYPTISSGLAQIEQKIVNVLDTILELPLQNTFLEIGLAIDKTGSAMDSFNSLAVKLDELIAKDEVQALPESMKTLLDDLNETLAAFSKESEFNGNLNDAIKQVTLTMQEVQELAADIKAKPNSLIFGAKKKKTPKSESKSE